MTFRRQVILATILGLAAGFICFCHFYPLLQVSGYRLEIEGVAVGVGADLLSADTMRTNFFRQPLCDYSEALLNEHPEFASVNCRMSLKGEVVCEGRRKKPIAIACLPEAYGLTARGELVPLVAGDNLADLPLVTGVRIRDIEPFSLVSSPELQEALKICELLRAKYARISDEISQIDFTSHHSPILYFRNMDVRVIIGRGDYSRKLLHLDMILNRLDEMPAKELDLRYGRSIVARDLT